MKHPWRPKKPHGGFTLIELLIVMVVVAILGAVAWPSYTQFLVKGKRAAAQAQMMDIANREQQYFLANRGYADKATLVSNGYSLPTEVSGSYSYDVTADNTATPPSYLITFTPTGSQAGDGSLTLNNSGAKTPANKWQ